VCLWSPKDSSGFWQSFLERFALCCGPLSCLYVSSVVFVCDVGILWPNGWTNQDETWQGGRPRTWPHCVRWRPCSPSHKGAQPPNFWPISVAAKWLDGLRSHLARWYDSAPSTVLDGNPAPLPEKGAEPPILAHFYSRQTAGWITMSLGREIGLGPGDIVLDGDPAPQKGHNPQFSAHVFVVAKRLYASGYHLLYLVGLRLSGIVLDGVPATSPR